MFCPQCGQQSSADGRFCRHCGFSLGGVKSLLAPAQSEGGADLSPSWMDVQVGADPRSRRGLHHTAYLLLLPLASIFLLIAQGALGLTLVPFSLLGKAFFLLMLVPLGRFAYAVYEAKQEWKQKGKGLGGAATRGLESPAAQSVNVMGFSRRQVEAAEVAEPPSVVEHTTKQLHQRKD